MASVTMATNLLHMVEKQTLSCRRPIEFDRPLIVLSIGDRCKTQQQHRNHHEQADGVPQVEAHIKQEKQQNLPFSETYQKR